MPNTPNKNLPYPDPTDLAGLGNEHIGDLALAVDALPAATSPWVTGDTKISAQAATHADPAGGTWYLADGSAVPPANTALVALLGANFPDGRGRCVVLKGTHADVNAIGDSDGVTLADRRPAHAHTFSQYWRIFQNDGPNGVKGGTGGNYSGANETIYGTIGPTANRPVDQPAFVVAGNLFYHS